MAENTKQIEKENSSAGLIMRAPLHELNLSSVHKIRIRLFGTLYDIKTDKTNLISTNSLKEKE